MVDPNGALSRARMKTEPGKQGFKEAVETDLCRLASLPANWDSYGAPVIDQQIIEAARHFVEALPESAGKPPRVVPMSTGNLQFEWHDGPKILELEFESPETIRYLKWNPPAGVEQEDSFPVNDLGRAVDLIH